MKALEAKLTSMLWDSLNDFKKNLPERLNQSQQDEISNSANKQQEQSKVVGRGY